MNILAVSPYYAPEGGGLERYAHEILNRLTERGHDAHAVTFSTQAPGIGTQGGVTVHRVQPLMRAGNTPVHPAFPLRVDRLIRSLNPDAVLAHTPVPFAAESAYLAAAHHGTPFVVTYHAGALRGGSPGLDALAAVARGTLQRMMLDGADRLIAVSPQVRDSVLNHRRSDTVVIPPGVDRDRFTPGSDRDPERVLFVGPLDTSYRWKGVDVLFSAFRRVHDAYPGAVLELVGTGDRVQELKAKAQEKSLPIRFRGTVEDAELVEAYRRAGVTVLPSTSPVESFGMVLAEANACGCPVVASRVGGIPHVVREGQNGLLACPGDVEDLARALSTLLGDRGLAERMGRRGRELVVNQHGWDALTRRTEQVLVEAVNGATVDGGRVSGDIPVSEVQA